MARAARGRRAHLNLRASALIGRPRGRFPRLDVRPVKDEEEEKGEEEEEVSVRRGGPRVLFIARSSS